MSRVTPSQDPRLLEDAIGGPVEPLLSRCREGDEAAWAELYRACGPTVSRFLRCLLGPAVDLDDAVQQVFVELVVSLERFRGDSSLTTWLYSVAAHVARKQVRTEVRWRRRVGAFREWAEGAPGPGDPADTAEARYALRIVAGAVEQLRFPQRAVWVMHEIEGLEPAEIAKILNTTAVCVRVRLFRARREIAAAIGAQGAGLLAAGTAGGNDGL